MEHRIGIVGIVVEDPRQAAELVNRILSHYGDIIIGRMGLPYQKRSVCIISVMVDGTNDQIGALTGKLGRIPGVNVKSVLTSKNYKDEEVEK